MIWSKDIVFKLSLLVLRLQFSFLQSCITGSSFEDLFMPIVTIEDPENTRAVPGFFNNLAELDEWALGPKHLGRFDGIIPYKPRLRPQGIETKGKLLVCHDYKGGYSETPSSLAYTFNFWDRCESFCYFSHRRVTIPPPGWVTAAHRQGVKMLGVLIFEGNSTVENFRLLVGPEASTGITGYPVSMHYARVLAELAHERGFDGYLMNFESSLSGGSEQARATEAWLSLLVSELKLLVGEHAEVSWYDSIVTDGYVSWQNELNGNNLPFFLASDTIFTNYGWGSDGPARQLQYFQKLSPALFQRKAKHPSDIYMGVDVWGRGQYGGGKFNSYKAVEKVDPDKSGLSVAFFAPAYTWESIEGNADWSWNRWWANERKMWVDLSPVNSSDSPKPIVSFFQSRPPPNPSVLPFFTSFSPGVGYSWFVEGKNVLFRGSGWTDIDKQTTLGDQLWPKPSVLSIGDPTSDSPPSASGTLVFTDAFSGGSSLIIRLSGTSKISSKRFWVPLQSLALTPGIVYEVQMVYKLKCATGNVLMDLSLTTDQLKFGNGVSAVGIEEKTNSFKNDWSKAIARFEVNEGDGDQLAFVGIVLKATFDNTALPYEIDIHLGQISIHQAFLAGAEPYKTQILWAKCSAATAHPQTLSITWDTSTTFTRPAKVEHIDPTYTNPPWILDHSPRWFPGFLYFNVYVIPRPAPNQTPDLDRAIFIGTSGGDGMHNHFVADRYSLPEDLKRGPLRVLVQGVTDRGEVMAWEVCKSVDVNGY